MEVKGCCAYEAPQPSLHQSYFQGVSFIVICKQHTWMDFRLIQPQLISSHLWLMDVIAFIFTAMCCLLFALLQIICLFFLWWILGSEIAFANNSKCKQKKKKRELKKKFGQKCNLHIFPVLKMQFNCSFLFLYFSN